MDSSDSSIAKGSLVTFASLVVSTVISISTTIYVARMIGSVEFGLYAIVLSTQSVLVILAQFGMPRAFAKLLSEYRISNPRAGSQITSLGLMMAVVLAISFTLVYVAAAGFIGNELYGDPRISLLIPSSSLVVFSSTILGVFRGLSQGYRAIKILAGVQILTSTSSFLLVFLLVPSYAAAGVFYGFFVSQMISSMVGLVALRKKGFSIQRCDLVLRRTPEINRFLSFSFLSFLSGLVFVPVLWFGNSELMWIVGEISVGHFAIAYGFFTFLLVLPTSLVTPLLPRLSELSASSPRSLKDTACLSVRYSAIVMFPIVLFMELFSDSVLNVLYGSEYLPAYRTVSLMMIAGYLSALCSILATSLVGEGRMRTYLMIHCIWAASFVVSTPFAVSAWGTEGLAFVFIVTYGVAILCYSRFSGLNLSSSRKTITASAVILSVGYLLLDSLDGDFIGCLAYYLTGTFIVLGIARSDVVSILRLFVVTVGFSRERI